MATRRKNQLKFRDKLILNQWLISQLGIDPLEEHCVNGKKVRAFHRIAEPIRSASLEGLDKDNLHYFFHYVTNSPLFSTAGVDGGGAPLTREQLLVYEENIVRHTHAINAKRSRKVLWKYYQWLSLLFVEIYLDRFFSDKYALLQDLNAFVQRFNERWKSKEDITPYTLEDLNKICLQNATGSGKTLLMHVNVLQYRHYATRHQRQNELSRIILITPDDKLSKQHIDEFTHSSIAANRYLEDRGGVFGMSHGLNQVDVLEITTLADTQGPSTVATRSLGDNNLLLIDEGHRGLSGTQAGAWFERRSMLSQKGFSFEYSATFEQAVTGTVHEDDYAKAVLFDYSYRWFYEDGFGKDYQILNLPKSHNSLETLYMTACLLKFYQQLCIYKDKESELATFYIEKPLWVFVGHTVSAGKLNKTEEVTATDVAKIIRFLALFLAEERQAIENIQLLLDGRGKDTGLVDEKGYDIFDGAFNYLAQRFTHNTTPQEIYRDILAQLFHSEAGGNLSLERVKGDSGEIILRAGTATEPFGLISVGEAKILTEHIEKLAAQDDLPIRVGDSDFNHAIFETIKDSSSPVNILLGAKKFVEGWDCWRVSTLGLMHVGKTEGAQIIQLFGRGVRLKGYNWGLKRSGHSQAQRIPDHMEELETLNVFGIAADFMENFKKFLTEQGLPGNERRQVIQIPLNVTHDFGTKLKTLRPKRKKDSGEEYSFKKDARVPNFGEIPPYLTKNPVTSDWYPRIATIRSRGRSRDAHKEQVYLRDQHLAYMDYDQLYFELEQFKAERGWYNFNISKEAIQPLLQNADWYRLYLPQKRLKPESFEGVLLLQQITTELLKRYIERYYRYCQREFLEPRLEYRELTPANANLPEDEFYNLIVDASETQVIRDIEKIRAEIDQYKDKILEIGDMKAINLRRHLFRPLLHLAKGSKITIAPASLNESEFQFVEDVCGWCERHQAVMEQEGVELYLLRNKSRGDGVGFFEAGGFYPDFILWLLKDEKQYVTFIEPHGLKHDGPGSEKILFHKKIKDLEARLRDPNMLLNSFVLSWTPHPELDWGQSREELADQHVLFMTSDRDRYLNTLFRKLGVVTPDDAPIPV